MGLAAHAAWALTYVAALAWMLLAPDQRHRWEFVLASVALSWTCGTVLLWIGRPAADEPAPTLTSTRALLELVVAGVLTASTGWHALLLAAAFLLVVRTMMRYSYQTWGGVRASSIAGARWMLAIAVPLIARLPESSLTSGAR